MVGLICIKRITENQVQAHISLLIPVGERYKDPLDVSASSHQEISTVNVISMHYIWLLM